MQTKPSPVNQLCTYKTARWSKEQGKTNDIPKRLVVTDEKFCFLKVARRTSEK